MPQSPQEPSSGLFGGLAKLESRHAGVPFTEIRERLDREPGEAWRILVEKYSRYVYSVARKMSAGLDDPEEFSAELYRRVFVRLEAEDFSVLRAFGGRCAFRTYLFRIIRTERFRLFRRRGVERDAYESVERDAAATPVAAPAPAWARAVARSAAQAALRELSGEDREVLVLRFAGDLKLRELADVLGARDTNDAAYRLRKAIARCGVLGIARESREWNEEAFDEARRALRHGLFSEEDLKNLPGEVSDGTVAEERSP